MRNIFLILMLLSFWQINAQVDPGGMLSQQSMKITQSSTQYGHEGKLAVDADHKSYAHTTEDEAAWINIKLDQDYRITGLDIDAPKMENFYIFFSKAPFNDRSVSDLMDDPWVDYLHITEAIAPGKIIPIGGFVANNMLIASARCHQALKVKNIGVQIGKFPKQEICDNGIDDDGDGRIDCADRDCGVGKYLLTSSCPSCATCFDGFICFQSWSGDMISIDGGQTFTFAPPGPLGNSVCINGLGEGTYDVVIQRSSTGCQLFETVVLDCFDNPDTSCDNRDFEDGDFGTWNGVVYRNRRGDIINPMIGFDIPTMHEIIPTQGFSDPNAPLNVRPELGNFVARLGDMSAGGRAATLTKCFTVDANTSSLDFMFSFVTFDPDHNDPDDNPFFQFRAYENGNATNVIAGPTRISSNSPILTDASNDPNDSWRYIPWDCYNMDLSSAIGIEVCIEFMAAGCGFRDHQGYAYVEVLCPGTDLSPIATSIEQTNTCQGLDVSFTGHGDFFTSYSWDIIRINSNGNPIDQVNVPQTIGQNPAIDDVISYYRAESGNQINCEKEKLRVVLNLINNCGTTSISQDIDVPCPTTWKAAYPNIFTPKVPGPNSRFNINFNATEINGTKECEINGLNQSYIDYYRLLVFDRWGNKIFDETELDPDADIHGREIFWDGTYKNQFVVPGIYTWIAHVGRIYCSTNYRCFDCAPGNAWTYCSTNILESVKDENGNPVTVEIFADDVTVIH